jgi:hypothetical protein
MWVVRETLHEVKSSKAWFCGKQNKSILCEADTAWRFRRNLNLAVPTILKTSLQGRFFIVRTGPFKLFRAAKRSTAQFCDTQNIHPIREAHSAGTERSGVNLAVPTL